MSSGKYLKEKITLVRIVNNNGEVLEFGYHNNIITLLNNWERPIFTNLSYVMRAQAAAAMLASKMLALQFLNWDAPE